MSSILRINSITSRSGINTLDFTGNGFSYVTDVGFGTTSPRGKLDVQGTFLANGGNAGIGTTLPTSRLDVVGDVQVSGVVTATSFRGDGSNLTGVAATSNIRTNAIVNSGVTTVSAGTTAIPSISPSGDSNTGIFFPKADTVAIGEGGAEALRINSSGNVGVGTNNPSQKLEVFVNRTSSTSATSIILNDNVTGAQTDGVFKAIRSLSNNGLSVSEIRFVETDGTNNNTAIVLATSSTAGPLTEGFRVHQNGNVGIGITNPSEKLVVAGKVVPSANNTHDLGSSSLRWANIFSADLQLSNEGSQNDIDGTWGNYTIQEGENDLFLINRRNGKKYKFVLQEVN